MSSMKHNYISSMRYNYMLFFSSNEQTSSKTFWPHLCTQLELALNRVLSWLTFARLVLGVLQIASMLVSVRIHKICHTPRNGLFWWKCDHQAYKVAFRGLCSFTGWYLGLKVVKFTVWSTNKSTSALLAKNFPRKKWTRSKPLLYTSQQKLFVKLMAGGYLEVSILPGRRSMHTFLSPIWKIICKELANTVRWLNQLVYCHTSLFRLLWSLYYSL